MSNLVNCTRISVDCVENDPVDVRAGGPEYLGFDFNVRSEDVSEMKKFIATSLASFEVPVLYIYSNGNLDLSEDRIWTKERIVAEIAKDAEELKREAARTYYRR